MHEISKSVVWENFENISKCCLLKFLSNMLSVKLLLFFQAFIASDITFAMKPYFRGNFCTQGVREGLVVGFLRHVNSVCQVSGIPFIHAIYANAFYSFYASKF